MNSNYLSLFMLMLVLLCFQACGGGGSGQLQAQQQKTAVISFSTVSLDATAPIRGIVLEAVLPSGISVATKAGSNEIESGVLQGMNGYAYTGTYSATGRKIILASPSISPSNIPLGVFATLTCTVNSGYTLTESQFSSIVPVDFQVTGPSGIDLTAAAQPVTLKTTAQFGY